MSGLVIDEGACIGCGRCLKACANSGLELVGERPHRTARVTDGCTLCGSCVDSCPVGAISVELAAGTDEALADYHDVWVFSQVDAGEVNPVAFELLGKGRELADARGCRLVAVLGEGKDATADAAGVPDDSAPADAASQLIAAGADEVIACRDERLAEHNTEVFATWICRLVRARKPEILLFGATSFGRELAPAVAVRLQTGLTADCTVLQIDEASGLLQQTRPAFGGNLMATIVCPGHRPQMATVRPGVMHALEPDPAREGVVTKMRLGAGDVSRVKVLERTSQADLDSIADAEVLVVVGRGIGARKNLALMERFAQLIGGRLGCSRPLVESGWCTYPHQVGQTGLSVAPKLLVSVGISGAIQHLAGIGGAQTIVAINDDPDAPIFGVSQYSVVGDCVEIVSELVAQLES